MSVNAINAADAPQQKKSNAGTTIGAGVGLGAVGAGAGYMWGGKTPSLEEVFKQDADTFEASKAKMAEKDATAAATVIDEYDKISNDPDVSGKQSAYDTKKTEVDDKIKEVTDYDNKTTLDGKVTEAEEGFTKEKTVKIGDTDTTVKYDSLDAYKEDKKTLEEAEKAVANATDDATKATAQSKIDELKPKVEAFRSDAEKLEKAQTDVFNAKKAKFDADDATKELRGQLETAANDLKAARETAVGKMKPSEALTSAFGKVRKALTEGKGKAALWYGIGAAVVGLLAGALLGGKKEA